MKRSRSPFHQFATGWSFLRSVATLIAVFCVHAAVAADNPPQSSQGADAAFPNRMRTTMIVDQAILDPDENQIGEIVDLIINQSGSVVDVIVSVEGFQKVTIPFEQLQFEARWEYRILRGRDGVEQRVPWRPYPVITFLGSRKELQSRPRYQFDRRFPRGSASGWGIYSYPKAGPGMKPE